MRVDSSECVFLTEKSEENIKTIYSNEKRGAKSVMTNVKNEIFFMKNLYY